MGDNDYENLNGWIPILLQNPPGSGNFVRDPWVSWWEHRRRGSQGGVDCVANEGTPIYAPANCYIQNIALEQGGSGGRTVIATFNDGWKDYFMHLQSFVTPGSKQKGQVIGYTGRSVAPGYDPVAQHLHWHRLDPAGASQNYNGQYDPYGATSRRNPWAYFVGSSGAGGGYTPIPNTPPKRKFGTVFLLHCDQWGDWIIVPGVSARKIGNENVTNWLSSHGENGATGSYLPRIHVSNSDWNAYFAELAGFPVPLDGPEGNTWVNPALV